MKDRVILHCDLNNFFASVSLLSNPTICDMPVAVCGSVEERHGIVLAKNEVAKGFGVKTAEAVWQARAKCPDLLILSPNYEKYHEYSVAAHKIYERYTDLIEPFGIDECWLDVTGSNLLFGTGEEIAHRIRKEIKAELGITVSVGVSFNKVFAKLGSDMKKPDAVTVISRENYKEKVWPLPIGDLLFAGKSTVKRLRDCGIITVGDIVNCDTKMLERTLGKNGVSLKLYAEGKDDSHVKSMFEETIPKSIGRSVTPKSDIVNREQVWKIYLTLSEDIASNLRKYGLFAGGLTVHTRTNALAVKETSKALKSPLNTAYEIAICGMKLFDECYHFDMPLRSVGLRAINLKKQGEFASQQDLFGETDNTDRAQTIENCFEKVRKKFGADSLKRATTVEKEEE